MASILNVAYDYDLQVWHKDGIVQDCGHPPDMSVDGIPCCNQRRYHKLSIYVAREQHQIAEMREALEAAKLSREWSDKENGL